MVRAGDAEPQTRGCSWALNVVGRGREAPGSLEQRKPLPLSSLTEDRSCGFGGMAAL